VAASPEYAEYGLEATSLPPGSTLGSDPTFLVTNFTVCEMPGSLPTLSCILLGCLCLVGWLQCFMHPPTHLACLMQVLERGGGKDFEDIAGTRNISSITWIPRVCGQVC
jgi:hypothetical protein